MNDMPPSPPESWPPRPASQIASRVARGLAASCLARLLFYAGLILLILVVIQALCDGRWEGPAFQIQLNYEPKGASAFLDMKSSGVPEGFISLAAAILIGSGWLLRRRQFSLRYFLTVLAAIVALAIAGRKVEGYGPKWSSVGVRFYTRLDKEAETRLQNFLSGPGPGDHMLIGPYTDTKPPYAYSVGCQFSFSPWTLRSDCQDTGRQIAPQWIQLCNEIAKSQGLPVIGPDETRVHTEPQMPGNLD